MAHNFTVDFNNEKSIKAGEKIKAALENKGYTLTSQTNVGFDKVKFTYELKNPIVNPDMNYIAGLCGFNNL